MTPIDHTNSVQYMRLRYLFSRCISGTFFTQGTLWKLWSMKCFVDATFLALNINPTFYHECVKKVERSLLIYRNVGKSRRFLGLFWMESSAFEMKGEQNSDAVQSVHSFPGNCTFFEQITLSSTKFTFLLQIALFFSLVHFSAANSTFLKQNAWTTFAWKLPKIHCFAKEYQKYHCFSRKSPLFGILT